MSARGTEPIRTCVGCRRRAPVGELIRLRRTAEDGVEVGPGPGRGAWICAPPDGVDCLDRAQQRRALERALRGSVRDGELQRLRAKLQR